MMQVGNGKSDGSGFFENQVSISLVHKTKAERRELRKKLEGELNLVRNMVKRLEHCGSGLRSFGDNGVNNGVGKLKRVHSEVGSVGWHEGRPTEKVENDKKNPKMNQFYPSSEQNKRAKGMGKKNGESGSRIGMSNSSSKVFKSCALLLDRLMKHKHGWVFNVPVDVKALGLHDYFTIIKHPMDLGTVKSRLNTNWYKSPKEFAEDVRLTFRNAMTYNPKGHDVHIMAEILSKMFEEKWSSIEAEYERDMKAYVNHEDSLLNPSSRKVPPSPSPSLPAYATDMTKTLDNSKTMTNSAAANPKNISSTPPGRTPVPKKPKAKDLHKRAMTYVEKKKLSYELQNLPPEKLGNIVEIIKKRNPALCQNDDEIEIDIDSVDIETLWELDRFVMNCKKNLNKTKKTADLTQAREGTNPTVEEDETQSMLEEPREKRTEEKNDPSLLPAQREKKFANASRSNSSKSSSSDSGASSNGSDTDTLST